MARGLLNVSDSVASVRVPVTVDGWEVGCCLTDIVVGGEWTACLRLNGQLRPSPQGPAHLVVADRDDGTVDVAADLTRVVRHRSSTKRRGAIGNIGFAWDGELVGPATGVGRFAHAGHEDQSHATGIECTGVVSRIRWFSPDGRTSAKNHVDESTGHYLIDLDLPDE